MIPSKARLGDCISAIYGLLRPMSAAPSGCRVLMYHAVGGEVAGDTQRLYSIAPDLFRAHVLRLSEAWRGRIADLRQCVTRGHGLAITFDDGYRDNLTLAAPLLAEHAMPFTVFVTPAFVMSGAPAYLDEAALKALAALPGVTIGSHGLNHRRLTECDDRDLTEELTASRTWLEDRIGRPVTTMSYPHGAVDARVRAAVARAGYEIAACSRFGTYAPGAPGADPLLVPRIDIWSGDGVARLAAKAAGHWDWMAWRTT